MNHSDFSFETLVKQSAGGERIYSTFAYWLCVTGWPFSRVLRSADWACAAMSHQYDTEEQDNLRGFPQYVPRVIRPIAPVTVAYRWSPFPRAIELLGQPTRIRMDEYGTVLMLFEPSHFETANDPCTDLGHFEFLLKHACERAMQSRHLMFKRQVFLCGSPGWSYKLTGFNSSEEGDLDCCYENEERAELMKEFGFVHCSRKPPRK